MIRTTYAATALRWLAFMVAAAAFVLGPFERTFTASERYGYLPDIMPSDWIATNVWLDSSACALRRGAWLALCEGDELIPISERAVADDPGHALLLDMWAMVVGRRATLVDVARLNTLVDTLGLLALAALVLSLRAYTTAILLLWLGPFHYLTWMGTSPHWSYIGLVSLCALLPMTLAAKGWGLLTRRAASTWMGAGLLALAVASLMRESIGLMGLLVTLAAVALLILRGASFRPLALTLALAVLAFSTPKWVIVARDTAFPMQPATRVATHGLSHTLYLGLGAVENKWGIRYDDDYGRATARAIDPAIVFASPKYFALMGRLYIERWLEDPVEVLRIYLEKAWRLLATYTMSGVPPFGLCLLLGVAHLIAATWTRAWQRLGFHQGQVIEGVAVSFLLLLLAQAMLALPDQTYAMPANAFILLTLAVIGEFLLRLLLRVRRAW